ncbi:phage tail spike protein [Streptococcus gordonii]|uniref:phage tail spike protein n=1 Tax=Streptococcus gordonii TaxID=1302 RepID=UPI002283E068|nr:phage tail spike protein [Streptococcus gordonii]MCY7133701.1 gp58-like family protein [Streptococcus gordonii]
MKPILFNKNEQQFDTYGLGEIDVTTGNVTRERNGLYTFYAEYPANGPLASVLEKEMKIKVDAGLRTKNQTIEISRIVKDSSGVLKIYGSHIKHKLEYMAVRHGINLSGTASVALAIWANNLIGDYRFSTWSDIDTTGSTTFTADKMTNAHLALGGVEGSILDVWGGEYEFDNLTVRLHKQLGRRAPTVLEYGRNIISAESDESIEESYTSVYPFATYTPESQGSDSTPAPVTVTIPGDYVDSKYISMYANRRIKVVDFSSEFKEKEIPTPDKLRAMTLKFMEHNKIGAPKINTKIEYVDLASTLDYQDNKIIEELEFCDIVPVYYPSIGITEDDAKVTKIVYDFVNERNESVEFGIIGESIRSAMTGGLSGRMDSLENRQKAIESGLPDYLLNASGNKVWYQKPAEGTEHKVGDLWFEKNGQYDRMYVWNGEMWEKRIDTEDVDRVKKDIDEKLKQSTESIQQVENKASEALTRAGAIIDSQELLDKINASVDQNVRLGTASQIFKSQTKNISDLSDKHLKNRRSIADLKTATTEYQRTNDENLVRIGQQLDNTVSKAEMKQTADGIRETIVELKTNGSGGPNMIRNSRADEGLKYWETQSVNFQSHGFYFNGQKRMFALTGVSWMKSPRFLLKKNTAYMLNFFGFNSGNTKSLRVYIRKRKKGETQDYTSEELLFNPTTIPFLSHVEAVKKSFKFNTGDFDEGYLYIFNGGPNNGSDKWSGVFLTEFDLYEGTTDRKWQPAPEDGAEWLNGKITTLDRTLDGIRATVTEAKSYIDADGQRRQEINQLIRDETAKGINTVLSTVEQSGYAKRTEIQSITETQRLYDRIIGTTEDGIKQNIARMTLTDSLFQTEVSKVVNQELTSSNYVANPFTMSDYVRKYFGKGDTSTVSLVSSGLSAFGKLEFQAHSRLTSNDAVWLPLNRIPERVKDLSFSIIIEGIDKCNISVAIGTENASSSVPYKRQGDTIYGTWTGISYYYKGSDGVYLKISFSGLNGESVFLKKPIIVEGREPKFDFEVNKRMEVDQAVRSVQTQLAGSWAIKNLNSAGDLISGINLGADGRNRITGKLTHITNETLMDRASIKSAAIESITADQITTGTLNASRINVINLNARSITSGTFRGLEYEGGIIRGNNGNTIINLNTNITTYNGTARIEFKSAHNNLVYSSSGTHAFLAPTQRQGTSYAAWAFGVGTSSSLDPNAGFVGLKIFNDPGSRKVILVGDVQIVKDTFTRDAPATALSDVLSQIQYNFVQIKNWFSRNDLGHPGLYDIEL